MGMGLLLLAASCSVHGVKATVNDPLGVGASSPITRAELKSEITKFYKWLRKTRQLLHLVRPYHKTWLEERELDPDTLEPLPRPEIKKPSPEEVQEELDKLMKDPKLQKVKA